MNLLQKIIYSFISGVSSVVPVSAQGHQILLLRLFGQSGRDPILDLAAHLGLAFALVFSCRSFLGGLTREIRISKRYRRTRSRQSNGVLYYDLRFLRTALIPTVMLLLVAKLGFKVENRPTLICLFFIVYGTILYICDHIRQGNKDSQDMSALDSILVGLSAGLSVIPGFSRVGLQLCILIGRGADRQRALEWVLVLGIAVAALSVVFDVAAIISAAVSGLRFLLLLSYLLSVVTAFVGGYLGVFLMRFLIVRGNLAGFGYYCWGAALFSFVLYLIV